MNLYRPESSNPKTNAQRNLAGRSHYVDDDTLRWHKSRVLSARATHNGLLFAIITSDALDPNGRKRGFRYVVFDIFGTVLARPKLEEALSSSERATKAMWDAVNAIDAKAVTLAAIETQARQQAEELAHLKAKVEALEV